MRKTTKEAIYERLRVKRTNVKFEYGSSFTFIHGLNLFKRAKPTENYLHRRLKYAKVEVYFTKVFYLLLHMLFVRLKAVCNNV